MAEPINPEKPNTPEAAESDRESQVEGLESNYIQGAELLEEPQSGSFIFALQAFVAWVKTLVN